MTSAGNDLEARLRERATPDLQRALYRNELVPEAAAIARDILKERSASIPVSMTDGKIEAEQRSTRKRSEIKFWMIMCTIVGWIIYAFAFNLFDPENGARLQHSVYVTGLFLAMELGIGGFKR
jgi:hypothetical protein